MIPTWRKIDVSLCEILRDLREINNFLPQISLIHAEKTRYNSLPYLYIENQGQRKNQLSNLSCDFVVNS